MIINPEKKEALFLELEPYIENYLRANSCTHLDGKAKSDNHVIISKILVDFIFEDKETSDIESVWRAVHSVLRDILTDRMDEVIGFPINTPLPLDLSDLSRKFFNAIVMNFKQIEIDANGRG